MRQVAAAVIIEDGRLFLARRAAGQKLAGYWELPGGKLEADETPQQALERELAEEFGMTARAGEVLASTVYEYNHGRFEMLAVKAERLSNFCLLVHDAYMWSARDGLSVVQLAPADVEIVSTAAIREALT